MSFKGIVKLLFGLVVLAAIGAFLDWVYVEGRKEAGWMKEPDNG